MPLPERRNGVARQLQHRGREAAAGLLELEVAGLEVGVRELGHLKDGREQREHPTLRGSTRRDVGAPRAAHAGEPTAALEARLAGEDPREGRGRAGFREQRRELRSLDRDLARVAEAALEVDLHVAGNLPAREVAADRRERQRVLRHREGCFHTTHEQQVGEIQASDRDLSLAVRGPARDLEGAPKVDVVDGHQARLGRVLHDQLAVLHGERLHDDPERDGRGRRARARRAAAEPLVVEDAAPVHGQREHRLLERQPLHLDAAAQQRQQAVAQHERVGREQVARKRRRVLDRDAFERHPGQERDVDRVDAQLGSERGPGLGEDRLPELGRVQPPHGVEPHAGRGQEDEENQREGRDQDLLHRRLRGCRA